MWSCALALVTTMGWAHRHRYTHIQPVIHLGGVRIHQSSSPAPGIRSPGQRLVPAARHTTTGWPGQASGSNCVVVPLPLLAASDHSHMEADLGSGHHRDSSPHMDAARTQRPAMVTPGGAATGRMGSPGQQHGDVGCPQPSRPQPRLMAGARPGGLVLHGAVAHAEPGGARDSITVETWLACGLAYPPGWFGVETGTSSPRSPG